jgi:hypothetical protein
MKQVRELKVSDVSSGQQTSGFTRGFQNIRRDTVGPEKSIASCDKAGFDDDNDSIVFVFSTPSTYEGTTVVDPHSLSKAPNSGNSYQLLVLVLNFITALKELKGLNEPEPEDELPPDDDLADSESESDITTAEETEPVQEAGRQRVILSDRDIDDVLNVCDIKFWSNDPSFQFQGMNYYLSQLDASIYPENRKPQKWDKINGGAMSKHLSGLVEDLKHFYGQMAQRVTKLLRDKGVNI